jgi:hypothetical protein
MTVAFFILVHLRTIGLKCLLTIPTLSNFTDLFSFKWW